MTTVSEEHDSAVQRLDAALDEQYRMTGSHEAARGTSAELPAEVQRRAADQEVVARETWLKWVDDDGFRGLNAGPFDLLRELEDARGPVR